MKTLANACGSLMLLSLLFPATGRAMGTSFFGPEVAQSSAPARTTGIGDPLPQTLHITNANGKSQTVLSLKAPTDFMVLGFVDGACAPAQAALTRFGVIRDQYQGWGVQFYAVRLSSAALKSPVPVITDPGHVLTRAFNITQTPVFILIDNWGYLRYRGPIDQTPDGNTRPRINSLEEAIRQGVGFEDVRDPMPPLSESCPVSSQ